MLATPDGLRRLRARRVGSQLPTLRDKESSHRKCVEWHYFTSSSVDEDVGFWIHEAAKNLTLADGTPMIVHRFDDRWISAARGDVSYELDRQSGNLTYAGLTTNDGVTTITIGSGRCNPAAAR
jgi:hypothetical protein